MNKKKLLSLILSATMLMSTISVSALYSENVSHDTAFSPNKWNGARKALTNSTEIPSEYEFFVDGKSFSLLDADADGNFFVVANDSYGAKNWVLDESLLDNNIIVDYENTNEIDEETGYEIWTAETVADKSIYDKVSFNPEQKGNIAYWLNDETDGFLAKGNEGMELPSAIKNNLIKYTYEIEKITANSDAGHNQAAYYRRNAATNGLVCYVKGTENLIGNYPHDDWINANPIAKRTFTSKLSFLSISEVMAYADKIGVPPTADSNYCYGYLTRNIQPYAMGKLAAKPPVEGLSYVDDEDIFMQFYPVCFENDTMDSATNPVAYYLHRMANTPNADEFAVRPCFWLDKDFFKNVALDLDEDGGVTSIGSDVLSTITSTYDVLDLYYLYDEATLEAMGYIIPEYVPAEVIDPMEGYGNYPSAQTLTTGEKIWNATETKVGESPAENTFYVKDNAGNERRFILLDRDSEGNYFMMADETYGKKGYTTLAGAERSCDIPQSDWRFDPTLTTSVAYWLNNDFLVNGGGGKILPEVIVERLLEREWETENNYVTNKVTDYSSYLDDTEANVNKFISTRDGINTVRAKVAIPSISEYLAYKDKIAIEGRKADGTANEVMTRTAHSIITKGSDGVPGYITYFHYLVERYLSSGPAGYMSTGYDGSTKGTYGIRPVFWVDKDFFKDVELSVLSAEGVSRIGANVSKQIKQYNLADISDMYDNDELDAIGYNTDLPKAEYLSVGVPFEGIALTASYTYSPAISGALENGTTIQWYISDTVDGEFTPVEGATSLTYTPTSADLGKYLKVVVTPKDALNYVGARQEAITAAVSEYTVSEPEATLYDQDGDWLEAVSGAAATGLTVIFDFENPGDAYNRTIILALYNKDGVLVKMNYEDVTVPTGPSIEHSVSISDIVCYEGYYAKAFVWDSIDDMTPRYVTEF